MCGRKVKQTTKDPAEVLQHASMIQATYQTCINEIAATVDGVKVSLPPGLKKMGRIIEKTILKQNLYQASLAIDLHLYVFNVPAIPSLKTLFLLMKSFSKSTKEVTMGFKPKVTCLSLVSLSFLVKTGKAGVTMTVAEKDFIGLMTGSSNAQSLFMGGKLKLKGNMGLAMKLGQLQSLAPLLGCVMVRWKMNEHFRRTNCKNTNFSI